MTSSAKCLGMFLQRIKENVLEASASAINRNSNSSNLSSKSNKVFVSAGEDNCIDYYCLFLGTQKRVVNAAQFNIAQKRSQISIL